MKGSVGHVEPECGVRFAAEPLPEGFGVLRGVERFERDVAALDSDAVGTH
jgi:hypothetical protein